MFKQFISVNAPTKLHRMESSTFMTVIVDKVEVHLRIVLCHSTMQNPCVRNSDDDDDEKYSSHENEIM